LKTQKNLQFILFDYVKAQLTVKVILPAIPAGSVVLFHHDIGACVIPLHSPCETYVWKLQIIENFTFNHNMRAPNISLQWKIMYMISWIYLMSNEIDEIKLLLVLIL